MDEKPVAGDIGKGDSGDFKWFSGQWWAKRTSMDHYATREGVLGLSLGGDLVSAPRDFTAGKLPLLSGAGGFYVEFDVRLSDNDADHFPAVWLMPAEHSAKMLDQYKGDAAGYQRWMELDVDEGGFGPGMTGTVHSHEGIYPDFKQIQNPNNVAPGTLDRTKVHTFGASFEPGTLTVTWWLDGVKQMSAGPPYVPAVAVKQHFYLILSAQTHGKNKPYWMYVSGVRAWGRGKNEEIRNPKSEGESKPKGKGSGEEKGKQPKSRPRSSGAGATGAIGHTLVAGRGSLIQRMSMADSEKTLDYLEQQIPSLAAAAVDVAYWQALAAGQTVLVSSEGGIYEVYPDGTRKFVKATEARLSVPVGTRVKIPRP
jgi:hypothetical protein